MNECRIKDRLAMSPFGKSLHSDHQLAKPSGEKLRATLIMNAPG
jgi:hypothetical protein